VTITGGSATYTPKFLYSGADSFTYTISDGKDGTATATVSVTVQKNQSPIANPDSASVSPGASVTIAVLANDSDPDGHTLKLNAFTSGTQGSVTKSGNSAVYTANTTASGNDSFTYTAGDGQGGQKTGTVSITITTTGSPANANPVAGNDVISTTANQPGSVGLLANDSDPDGDTLTVTNNAQGSNGTVAIAAGTATYTPKAGFAGADSFTYTISDGKGGSATGTVSVTVTAAANAVPQAVADAISTEAGKAGSVNVLANDTDADSNPLTVSANTQGANGSVAIAGGVATYTPKAGFTGSDSFTYSISDGKGGSATGTVSVTVAAAAAAGTTTSGKAVLNWTVPTTRANGSPLPASEIAGYEIYVLGQNSGKTNVIVIDDPLATTYTVEGLAPDTYHFSMVAKDTVGQLSEMSAVVPKEISGTAAQ
jgi:hypothetical protein